MFKFRFQKALLHKASEEKDAFKNLQEERNRKDDKIEELNKIDKTIEDVLIKYEEIKKGVLKIDMLISYENHINNKKKERNNKLKEIDILEKNILNLEHIFFELRSERKIFEKLKEKEFEKYKQEILKKEQKLIDEISNNLYNRSK